MIDGRTIDTGTGTLDVGQGLFAEGFRERIGVRPPDAGGAGAAGLDQLVLDPAFAELLGLGGERGCTGGSEFGAGLGAELLQSFAGSARGVGVGAQAPAGGHLVAPIDADVERAGAHQLFGCVAAAVAGDVTRRHGDEVRSDADVVAEIGDARRPEQVDLDGGVERGVERDRCRRVDHGVARGEDRPVGVVQAEAVAGDVAGDGRDACGDRREPVAVGGAQSVEGVVLEDLAFGPLRRRRALAVTNEQDQLALGHRSQHRSTSAVPTNRSRR